MFSLIIDTVYRNHSPKIFKDLDSINVYQFDSIQGSFGE